VGSLLGGNQEHVAGVASFDGGGGLACEVDTTGEVEAPERGKVKEAQGPQPRHDLLDGVEEGAVVSLDMGDGKAGSLESGADLVDRAGVGEAGNPAGETAELGVEPGRFEPCDLAPSARRRIRKRPTSHVGVYAPTAVLRGTEQMGSIDRVPKGWNVSCAPATTRTVGASSV
jgi:hypothetical protein